MKKLGYAFIGIIAILQFIQLPYSTAETISATNISPACQASLDTIAHHLDTALAVQSDTLLKNHLKSFLSSDHAVETIAQGLVALGFAYGGAKQLADRHTLFSYMRITAQTIPWEQIATGETQAITQINSLIGSTFFTKLPSHTQQAILKNVRNLLQKQGEEAKLIRQNMLRIYKDDLTKQTLRSALITHSKTTEKELIQTLKKSSRHLSRKIALLFATSAAFAYPFFSNLTIQEAVKEDPALLIKGLSDAGTAQKICDEYQAHPIEMDQATHESIQKHVKQVYLGVIRLLQQEEIQRNKLKAIQTHPEGFIPIQYQTFPALDYRNH